LRLQIEQHLYRGQELITRGNQLIAEGMTMVNRGKDEYQEVGRLSLAFPMVPS
jgi:hypothetical protein